jgi:hypothetical protein
MSALARAGDPELLHFGLESGPFHPKLGSRAGRPADDPLGRLERVYLIFGRAVHHLGDSR